MEENGYDDGKITDCNRPGDSGGIHDPGQYDKKKEPGVKISTVLDDGAVRSVCF